MEILQETIKAFVNGQLTATEQSDFEKILENDAVLATEVQLFRDLNSVAVHKDLFDLKNMVSEVLKNTPMPPNPVLPKTGILGLSRLFWLILPLTLIVATIGWFQNRKTNIEKMQAVVQPFITEHFENVIQFDSTDGRLLARAMRFYDAHNYADALPLIQYHLRQSAADTDAQFYEGLCLVLTQKYDTAIEPLTRVAITLKTSLSAPARWYLALCYLHKGDAAKARTMLESLENDTLLGEKAKKILSQLK